MKKRRASSWQKASPIFAPAAARICSYDGGQGKWVCDYCDSSYTKEELEQRGADTENTGYTVSPGDSGKTETVDFACEENVAEGKDQEHLRAYSAQLRRGNRHR